jgi:hypothetical protein
MKRPFTGRARELYVLVGVPSMGTWHERFGVSLVGMMTYFMAKGVDGYGKQQVRLLSSRGSILPRSRKDMVKQMLEMKGTHLLFVDSDQKFPLDTLHRLLKHDKDIIGANIATKKIPSTPTARGAPDEGGRPDGKLVFTDEDSHGIQEVWRLGTGVMLIKREVFEKIGYKCFEVRWVEEIQDYRGEDWAMCEAMQAAGYKIYIDHDLSNVVKHVGDYEYGHEVVGEIRQELHPLTLKRSFA